MKNTTLHGTAVYLEGQGLSPGAVFLRGASGSGKSDLAFRLIGMGGKLIADDQVMFERQRDRVHAASVPAIEGLLEVRGVGLLLMPFLPASPLKLVVDLVAREKVPRLPDFETVSILDTNIPYLSLHAFDASTPLKIFKALEVAEKPHLVVR